MYILDSATDHALLPPSRLYTSRKPYLSLRMARLIWYVEQHHASHMSKDSLSRGVASALESKSTTVPSPAFCSSVDLKHNVA